MAECRLAGLNSAGKALLEEKSRAHRDAHRQRDERMLKIGREIGRLQELQNMDVLQRIEALQLEVGAGLGERYVSDLGNSRFAFTHTTLLFQAQASLIDAEYCESAIAIRRLEAELWERGARPRAPKAFATRYQVAYARDPGFGERINAYAHLAAQYGEKEAVALAMAGLYRQGMAIRSKLGRVQDECERIEGTEKNGRGL